MIRTLPGAGSVLDIMISVGHVIIIASGYQEIHPYSAINIDSVKINTSLIMMKECIVLHCIGSEESILLIGVDIESNA